MTRAITKSRVDTSVETKAVCKEIDKVVIASIMVAAVVIGGWSLICLFSGMVAAGGPIALAKGFFMALGFGL